jgi:hypothetical protein
LLKSALTTIYQLNQFKKTMKKINRKAFSIGLKAVLLTSAMIWASGRTSTAQNAAEQGISKKLMPASVQKETLAMPNSKVITPNDKKVKIQSKEQLMFLKKQAAGKGLPAAEYDKAINQLNTNQAK